MPELPEVEWVRRQLVDVLVGSRVEEVTVAPFARFADASASAGATVLAVGRRGKYLLWDLELVSAARAELVVHLGMTGQLLWVPSSAVQARPPHVHVQWRLDGGVLWLNDPRRFARVLLVEPGVYASSSMLARLGPDPLDPGFDAADVAARLVRASQVAPVKAVLLQQRVVAGVGNYLADEALFAAGVHPLARRLSARRARRVVDALVGLVGRSLAAGGVSTRDYVHVDGTRGSFANQLQVYGRESLPCPRCAAALERVPVAGRSSTFCGRCQRR